MRSVGLGGARASLTSARNAVLCCSNLCCAEPHLTLHLHTHRCRTRARTTRHATRDGSPSTTFRKMNHHPPLAVEKEVEVQALFTPRPANPQMQRGVRCCYQHISATSSKIVTSSGCGRLHTLNFVRRVGPKSTVLDRRQFPCQRQGLLSIWRINHHGRAQDTGQGSAPVLVSSQFNLDRDPPSSPRQSSIFVHHHHHHTTE